MITFRRIPIAPHIVKAIQDMLLTHLIKDVATELNQPYLLVSRIRRNHPHPNGQPYFVYKPLGCKPHLNPNHPNLIGNNKPEYSSWLSAMHRCHNKKSPYYSLYGGRGIQMCESWRSSFETFLTDMGPRPTDCSLDRIDNNKGYSKDNCRWANRSTQAKNKRGKRIKTTKITQFDINSHLAETIYQDYKYLSLTQLLRKYEISYSVVRRIIHHTLLIAKFGTYPIRPKQSRRRTFDMWSAPLKEDE